MSSTQIPDLWPATVKVEILTPYAILRASDETDGEDPGHS
jgi:hypothetical protein